MKAAVWTLVFIGILMALLATASAWVTRTASDTFWQEALRMEDLVLREDWEGLTRTLDAVENRWVKARRTLELWIHHQDTDGVNMALGRLRAGLLLKDAALALEAVAEMKEACLHLHHRDALRLTNLI